jgi:hypothetical protein
MAAVNTKISIGRRDYGVGERFGHADQACIGEAHGYVSVLLHEPQHWLQVVCQVKSNAARNDAEAARLARARHALRHGGMPRTEQIRTCSTVEQTAARVLPPRMMSVATAEQRNHEFAVNEDVCGHSQWSASTVSFER